MKATRFGNAFTTDFKRECVRYMEHHALKPRAAAAEFDIGISSANRWYLAKDELLKVEGEDDEEEEKEDDISEEDEV